MGSGRVSWDDRPSSSGLIIETTLEVRRRTDLMGLFGLCHKTKVRNGRGGLSTARVFYLYLI